MPALIPLEWALRPPCLFSICRLNYVHPLIQMTTAGSVSGQLSGSGINSNADCSEASWTLTWLLRSSNAGLALMAVTPATTAANEQPRVQRVRNFGMFQCEMPLKHPPLYARKPPLYAQNPLCMGIPGNSQKRAVLESGIPMGIPAIPDLGNSRFGNSR
jgi:hypothetical protein